MPNIVIMDPNLEDQSQLVAGIYAVTITEQNGCETQKRFIVNQPTTSTDPNTPSFEPDTTSSVSGNVN